MIRDLSQTLRAILDDPALAPTFPELAAAQIVFDRPTEPFTPAQTTLNLFLYDVRENVELRSNEPIIERLNGQVTIHRPPVRVACSYLVTAWPVGGQELALQEHRLLSQALQALSRFPTIPAAFLQGSLVGQEPPLPIMTAQADGFKNPAEFWTALGNKLRPSLTLTVTIAMKVFAPEPPVPIVITGHARLGERVTPAEEKISSETLEEFFRIGGRVTDAAHLPSAKATVMLVETGLITETNADGRYRLGPIKSGTFTLRVQKGAAVKEVSITIPAQAGKNYDVQLP
jgi:hypothetical protein